MTLRKFQETALPSAKDENNCEYLYPGRNIIIMFSITPNIVFNLIMPDVTSLLIRIV